MPTIRGLTEVVIWVRDRERAVRFYRDTLGLKVMAEPDARGAVFLQASDGGDGVPQQVVLVPLPEGAAGAPAERTGRALHHIGIEIASEEFEREAERLRGLGFEPRFGEHPFLPLKGMYIDDPDGNEVELIAKK